MKKILCMFLTAILLFSSCPTAQGRQARTLAQLLKAETATLTGITLSRIQNGILSKESFNPNHLTQFLEITKEINLTSSISEEPADLKNGIYITVDSPEGSSHVFISNSGSVGISSLAISQKPLFLYAVEDSKKANELLAALWNTVNHHVADWAWQDVEAAYDAALCPPDRFDDFSQDITREDFCELAATFLQKTAGLEQPNLSDAPFDDTTHPSSIALYQAGIITGKSKRIFAPGDLLTREEAATILDRVYRYIEMPDIDVIFNQNNVAFQDHETISSWAKFSVYRMRSLAVMVGINDTHFAPKGTYTTEQAVVSIMRMYHSYQAFKQIETVQQNEKLPVIEVKVDPVSPPPGGLRLEVAEDLINDYFGGWRSIKIREITVPQAWENSRMQLYAVDLYPSDPFLFSCDAVAVIISGEVVEVLFGGGLIKGIYLADLDLDMKYEICVNSHHGSGYIDYRVCVLNVQQKKIYVLARRMEYDFTLGASETGNELLVYEDTGYRNFVPSQESLLGELILDANALYVQTETNRIYSSEFYIARPDQFPSKEYQSAEYLVSKTLKEYTGYELTSMWYDESLAEKYMEAYIASGRGSINPVDKNNILVLFTEIYMDPTQSDGTLASGMTYSGCPWILVKDQSDGTWRIDDWGV